MSSVYSNFSFRSLTSSPTVLRQRIDQLQSEIASGRQTTPAVQLGGASGPLFALRQESTSLQAYRDNIVASRRLLGAADRGLEQLSKITDEAQSLLLQFSTGALNRSDLGAAAQRLLESFPGAFASTGSEPNPLAGQSGKSAPVRPYIATPASDAETTYKNAFSSTFGFAIDDPQAANLTADEVFTFAEAMRSSYNDQANWEQIWLAAPVNGLEIPVSTTWKAGPPTAGNAPGIRDLAASLVNLVELAKSPLAESSFRTAAETIGKSIGAANKSLIDSRGHIGWQMSRLDQLDESYASQQNKIQGALSNLEGVDEYAAVAELNDLKSQLEISYTITSRIQDLFLARYIS